MKPETKSVIEKLVAKFAQELNQAFHAADPESDFPTPAELLAKRYEITRVGEKFTVGAAMSIVKTGDPLKPQCKVKVQVTLKAATPDGDYQELFDLPTEDNESA